jgi:hypothetical protein
MGARRPGGSPHETTPETSARLPPIDEDDDHAGHCEADTDEELSGSVASGEVEGPSDDECRSHHLVSGVPRGVSLET